MCELMLVLYYVLVTQPIGFYLIWTVKMIKCFIPVCESSMNLSYSSSTQASKHNHPVYGETELLLFISSITPNRLK